MDFKKVTERKFPQTRQAYTFRDTILYALGTGFASEPLDPKHLRFTYEENLVASPTIANVLGHPGMWAKDPEYDIQWKKLLHAEQRLIVHGVVPAEGEVTGDHEVMGLRDKGTEGGVFLHQRKYVKDAKSGDLLATVINTLLLRGDGGCGDFGDAPAELSKLPETEPDFSVQVTTLEMQALIYRLSGDYNPLHADPEVAKVGGFPKPIFHGLGTMGFAAYALLKGLCDFDASKLKAMAVRFSRPVMPGDDIRFDFWGKGPGEVRFRAVVTNRDNITVLDRCTAEIG